MSFRNIIKNILIKSNVADKDSDNVMKVIQHEIFEEQEKRENKLNGDYNG